MTAPTPAPVIDLDGVGFTYPDGHRALDGFTLTVGAGESVAVLGPNGSGKTTFALHLNGIHELQEGRAAISGLPIADDHLPEIRRRVGMVFQDTDDQLFMPSVREDVAFGPHNLGLRDGELDARVAEALEMVGASGLIDRAPHHLSGGERRRVALATVLSMQPDVLVLDEPTSGLDPAGRRELAGVLATLPITKLLITHDLPFALELCDRAIIVSGGRVVADGSCVDILADEPLLHAHRLELPLGFDPRAGWAARRTT